MIRRAERRVRIRAGGEVPAKSNTPRYLGRSFRCSGRSDRSWGLFGLFSSFGGPGAAGGPCWGVGSDTWCRKMSSGFYPNGVFPTSDASCHSQDADDESTYADTHVQGTPLSLGLKNGGFGSCRTHQGLDFPRAPTGARRAWCMERLYMHQIPPIHPSSFHPRRSSASACPIPSGVGKDDVNDRETPTGPCAIDVPGHRW